MGDKQARGYKGRLLMDVESVFGVVPDLRKPFSVPYNSCEISASQELNTAETITGTRNPVAPFEGNVDVSGPAVVPVDAHGFGLWLRAMFGNPVTTATASVNMDNGSARDAGSGKTGLPATGHGLEPGCPVIITGTTNYDGGHVLAPETSEDELVVVKTYAAETFDGTETIRPGQRLTLDAGDATDKGGGLVGLPCDGHGLPVGAEVTIAGTTNYDGTFTVQRTTSADELVISDTYGAETFDGSETITCLLQNHVFKIGEGMPSLVIEKQFPDIPVYLRADGLKVGSCSLSFGGSGELTASLNLTGRNESKFNDPYDNGSGVDAVVLPFHRFGQFQARLREGGEIIAGRSTTVNLNMDFGLDTDQYTIGSGGVRGDIPEGIMTLSGDMEALFKDTRFLDKAESGQRTTLKLELVNGGYVLGFEFQEMRYQRKTPGLSGPKGVKEDFSIVPFYDTASAGSAVVVTLTNEIRTYGA